LSLFTIAGLAGAAVIYLDHRSVAHDILIIEAFYNGTFNFAHFLALLDKIEESFLSTYYGQIAAGISKINPEFRQKTFP
jgi:hypothetical protein